MPYELWQRFIGVPKQRIGRPFVDRRKQAAARRRTPRAPRG